MFSVSKGSLTLLNLSFILLSPFAFHNAVALPTASSSLSDPSVYLSSSLSISGSSSYSPTPSQDASSSATYVLPSSSLVTRSSSTTSIESLPSQSYSTSSASSALAATVTPSPASSIQWDLDTIRARRIPLIIQGVSGANSISSWIHSLGPDGKWLDSEVDYSTGCAAQRANWPAATHWYRISTMAAAFHGSVTNGDQWVNNTELQNSISLAMDYWFRNDFTTDGCLYSGGASKCPCGTPGLWNTNWFSNVILVPNLVAETCLILSSPISSLTPTQESNCTHITTRAYGTFTSGQGFVSGANILDIAKIGVDEGLRTANASLVADAFGKIHDEVQIHDPVASDGIRRDGSFGQHVGLLYNGNYGKDYTKDDIGIELEAEGTQLAATDVSRAALETLIDGDQWMIYRNVLTETLHWDLSTLPRFISFPVADSQATGGINLNLTEILELGAAWNSTILQDVAHALSKNTNDANAGELYGNRMFYNNDYMARLHLSVHRGSGYVTTLKMFSTRTKNTECTNSQNPLGFHLSDGTVYTYLQGDEYEDIAAAWDWNLIPGTTVDYAGTPLDCAHASYKGIEDFVGGVTNGNVGASAMRYTNPYTGDLNWQKAWFFLDGGVQQVMINDIKATNDAPVYSVLDQRKHNSEVWVNGALISSGQGGNFTDARSIWHGNVGYAFDEGAQGVQLSVRTGNKTGDWSTIGTSKQPPETVDLFAAWVEHVSLETPLSYAVYPATDLATFQYKSLVSCVQTIRNDANVSAVYDPTHKTAMFVFWNAEGGSVQFAPSIWETPMTVSVDGNSAAIYDMRTGTVTISDPSQTLSSLQVNVSAGHGAIAPAGWKWGETRQLSFNLPSGGLAGGSLSQTI
ncbi:polysaccharide lyase family 8 protein [Neolentinus lepideus HHB14362 ss-1]|uniref:Polysaccharide lyase family 8 protein n=1 Tax=Neolentinus lepideus HHB14362 ss-1 TaxID=1314782 RepID=A0A165VZ32_9AGAM|nr:polysaccharide lyase family 8 protein [Neolentinus lepideus HHB14362 ss-1]